MNQYILNGCCKFKCNSMYRQLKYLQAGYKQHTHQLYNCWSPICRLFYTRQHRMRLKLRQFAVSLSILFVPNNMFLGPISLYITCVLQHTYTLTHTHTWKLVTNCLEHNRILPAAQSVQRKLPHRKSVDNIC